jgi:hypothetical protein
MSTLVALDGGWATTKEAEHAAHEVARHAGLPVAEACTHFLADPNRVAVTLRLSGPVDAAALPGHWSGPAAEAVVGAHWRRRSGRAFEFRGMLDAPRRCTVAELIDATAVNAVLVLGGGAAPPEADIDTQEFLRPTYVDGALVLRVQPGRGGVLVPFEQEDQGPCCGGH